MQVDSIVLNHICKWIDDPKTFYNFALVSIKALNVAMLNKVEKMDQFSLKNTIIDDDGEDCYITTNTRLPNGNLHGKQSYLCSYAATGDQYSYYYNGVFIADVSWDYDGYQTTCFLTRCYCDCSKDVPRDFFQTNVDLTGFIMSSSDRKVGNAMCKKCECGRCSQEVWVDKPSLDQKFIVALPELQSTLLQ